MSEPIDTPPAPSAAPCCKGTAGILATGMAPAIHAQEKIVLRYLGTAVNQDKAIAEKFKADTGIRSSTWP
jgi:putative spermidine/putrescine transport system substrate-binding protein